MKNQVGWRYFSIVSSMFIASWLTTSLYQMWDQRDFSAQACATTLRLTYVASKHMNDQNQALGMVESFKRTLFDGFRPTQEEADYLAQSRPLMIMQAQWALLCAEDPKFPVKVLMSRTTTLDFEPSYRLFPDRDTIAYCPFHHQAVLANGDIAPR